MEKTSTIDLQTYYPNSLKINRIEESEDTIAIHMKSLKHSHKCVNCEREMSVYHATYIRTVQDLPILGKHVTLKITSYDYFCQNDECEVKTFAEDYGEFIGRCGRMTNRLEDFIRTLALESNCEGAAAICKEMGIQVSGDSIIRMLRKLTDEPVPKCGDSIGVDDFAYRKGNTYCTVICDEKTHKAVEVLEGRDGKALKEWLKSNKQVKKVSRDRAGAYAKAISDELPEAMQIADRFHLHQNLLRAVKEALKCELPNKIAIPTVTQENAAPAPQEAAPLPIQTEEDKKN